MREMIFRYVACAAALALLPLGALAQTAPSGPASAAPSGANGSGAAGMAQDRLARIKASGVLRVGTTGDYKPYTYLDPATQAYSGMDIDVAQAFAKSLGVRVVFVATTWPTMTADLLADKFDVAMGGVSDSPERAAKGTMSHPYLTDGKSRSFAQAIARSTRRSPTSISPACASR